MGNSRKALLVALLCLVSASFFHGAAFEFDLEFDFRSEEGLPAAIIKAVDEAYEKNMSGLRALEKDDYRAAMSYFDEALDVYPMYSDAINNRGVVYFRRGDVTSAKKVWKGLAESDPGYAVGLYNLGLLAIHEGYYAQARDYLEAALKQNRRFVEAMVRLGLVHLKLGNKSEGLNRLSRAYRVAPDQQDVWNFYSYGLIAAGDTSAAVKVLEAAGEHRDAFVQLGRIAGVRENHDEAWRYLARAIEMGAESSVLLDLATVQLEAGSCRDALNSFDRFFSHNKQRSADAFLMAGVSAKECGDLTGAQDFFEQGIQFFPRDPLLRYNLGQLYFNRSQFQEAEAIWEVISDSLREPSLYYMRALNANRLGNQELAKKLVKQALAMDRRADFYDLQGVIYHAMGDSVKSVESFRTALQIDPDLRSAQLNLAIGTKSSQEIASAIADFKEQLDHCTGRGCTEVALQLSLMHYYNRDLDEAITALESVKEEYRNESIYRHMGIYYRELNNFDRAMELLQNAVTRFVVEVRTEYELAETYLLAGYPSRAAELIRNIIPRWRENPWRLYYQLGYAYLEQNDLGSARDAFERSLNANRANVAARGLLAFVLNRMGEVEEARALWQRNLRDDPDNPVLWINMGLSFEQEGRFSDALGYYQRAQMQQPGNQGLQINIGNVYMGMEKYREALHAYSRALNSDKRDLAAYNIFLLAQRTNELGRAGEMLAILSAEFSHSIHTRRAQAEMDYWEGDTLRALGILESLEEKDYYDWFALARIYASQGNRGKAQHALSELPGGAYWDPKKTWVMASIAFHTGDYHRALALFQQTGDTSFVARYNMALSAYNGESYEEALSMAEVLVKEAVAKDRIDVCRLAGNAAFALELWEKAKIWYRQLSNMESGNPMVLYNLAVAHYNLDEVEQAYVFYQRARELDDTIENRDIENRYRSMMEPAVASGGLSGFDTLDIVYNEAVAVQNAGDDTAAERMYLDIVKEDPRYSLAWNNLGVIYGTRGEIDKAEAAYLKALERRFDLPQTYANIVNLYLAVGSIKEARHWAMVGLGHNPESELLQELEQQVMEAGAEQ